MDGLESIVFTAADTVILLSGGGVIAIATMWITDPWINDIISASQGKGLGKTHYDHSVTGPAPLREPEKEKKNKSEYRPRYLPKHKANDMSLERQNNYLFP